MQAEEHVAGNKAHAGVRVGGAVVEEVVHRLLQRLCPFCLPAGDGGEGFCYGWVGAAAIVEEGADDVLDAFDFVGGEEQWMALYAVEWKAR